ncbi:GHKL domain-containing protein [Lachnospiraceae bacterium 64-25]
MENTLCFVLSFLVEAIVLHQYSSTLFIPRYRIRTKLAVLCLLYLLLLAVSMLASTWLNIFMYLLANFIFLLTQYRLKWQAAFFHSAILTAVMAICELAVYNIIQYFVPHFFTEAAHFHNKIIFIFFSKMIFFTIIYLFMHFLKDRQEYSQQHDHSSLLLVLIPLTSISIMFTLLTVNDTYTLSPAMTAAVTLDAVFLLITNLLVFGINQYNQKKNLEFTEMQLLLQKEANSAEYYQMLLSQNENQSILIHDIKKHLQSINLLNDKREHDKISAYIRQLLLSSDLKEAARLCDHEMLNTILCRCKRQCDSRKISFHVDIRHETIDFIADSDLTSLFGNLLDNAMEAAASIPEAYIEVSAVRRAKTPFVVITVINSCRKDPFSNPQGSLVTNKANKHKHGFGIKSIRKTVSKYHGDIQMYYNSDTLTFHTIITLKLPVRPPLK